MADLKADMDCDSDEDDVYEPIVLNNTHKKDRFSVSDKSVKLKGVNIPNGEEKLKHIKQEPDIKQEYIPAMLNGLFILYLLICLRNIAFFATLQIYTCKNIKYI